MFRIPAGLSLSAFIFIIVVLSGFFYVAPFILTGWKLRSRKIPKDQKKNKEVERERDYYHDKCKRYEGELLFLDNVTNEYVSQLNKFSRRSKEEMDEFRKGD